MITDRNLSEGDVLVARYKGAEYRTTVKRSPLHGGKLIFEYDGKAYASLSTLGSEITRTAVNGWRFWTPVAEFEAREAAEAEAEGTVVAKGGGKKKPAAKPAPAQPAGVPKKRKAKARKSDTIRPMQVEQDQDPSIVKYWCSACQRSFERDVEDAFPEECPAGHARDFQADSEQDQEAEAELVGAEA